MQPRCLCVGPGFWQWAQDSKARQQWMQAKSSMQSAHATKRCLQHLPVHSLHVQVVAAGYIAPSSQGQGSTTFRLCHTRFIAPVMEFPGVIPRGRHSLATSTCHEHLVCLLNVYEALLRCWVVAMVVWVCPVGGFKHLRAVWLFTAPSASCVSGSREAA